MPNACETARKKTPWWYVAAVWLVVPFFLFFLLEILLGAVSTPKSSPLLVQFVNPEWRDGQVYRLDPKLFWTFHPNQQLRGDNGNGPYSIRVNNLGFRGPDFPAPETERALRISVLGDSCAFGVYAGMGDNFPERLKARLEAAYPGLRVVLFNGGVPGYSSQQSALVLEEYGRMFHPDLVLIYTGACDILPRVLLSDREILEEHRGELRRAQFFENSRTFLFFRGHFAPQPKVDIARIFREHSHTGPFRVELPDSRENLERMLRYTRDVLEATPVLLTRQNLFEEHPTNQVNDLIRQLAAEHDVPLVDVARHFRQWPEPQALYSRPDVDIVHPNVAGYREIAQLTFTTLEESPQTRPLLAAPAAAP